MQWDFASGRLSGCGVMMAADQCIQMSLCVMKHWAGGEELKVSLWKEVTTFEAPCAQMDIFVYCRIIRDCNCHVLKELCLDLGRIRLGVRTVIPAGTGVETTITGMGMVQSFLSDLLSMLYFLFFDHFIFVLFLVKANLCLVGVGFVVVVRPAKNYFYKKIVSPSRSRTSSLIIVKIF